MSFSHSLRNILSSFKAFREITFKKSNTAQWQSTKSGIWYIFKWHQKQTIFIAFGLLNFGLCRHGNYCVLIHLHAEVFNRL